MMQNMSHPNIVEYRHVSHFVSAHSLVDVQMRQKAVPGYGASESWEAGDHNQGTIR